MRNKAPPFLGGAMYLTDEQDLWQCIYSYSIARSRRKRVHPLVTKISTSSGIYCREAKRYQKSIFRFAGKLAPLNKCLQKKVKFIALADEWENKELLQSC